jgi:hypothetical protein
MIDLNNALYAVVHQEKKDTAQIYALLAKIQKKGVCVHQLYQAQPGYEYFLAQTEEKNCRQVLDTTARQTVLDCMERDQLLRKFSEKRFYNAYDASVLAAINAIDSFNFTTLSRLLDTLAGRGGTLEEQIGYPQALDLYTVFQHNASWARYNSTQFVNLVQKGFLEARKTAETIDLFCFAEKLAGADANSTLDCDKMCGVYGSSFASIFSKKVVIAKILQPALLATIQKNRNDLLLGDVYENAKIVAYAFYAGNTAFNYPGIMQLPDEYADRVINNLTKAGKPFILYSSAEDYDFTRKW